MNKDYLKYNAEDFLMDDYFVDTMLEPNDESKAFWKSLTDENKVDINEFISAYMTLKNLNEVAPVTPAGRDKELWKRIQHTNQIAVQRKKRLAIFRYSSIAASILFILGISIFSYLYNGTNSDVQSLSEFATENTIHTRQPNSQIQLISDNKVLNVVGVQAKVEYDQLGKVKVNEENIQSKESKNATAVYNQLRVPYGKRAFLTLSDGTRLWINTGTTVSYPSAFANDKREIYVDGEVFAEVSPDKNRPFIIRTNNLDVQVLGTSFNVTAYKTDKESNVVLVEGSVNVKPRNGNATTIKPNQLFAYTDQATTLRTVEVENFTSWKEGIYIFKNEPIENILLRLSRYYNVTMKLPLSPSGISCSGKLELKDDLTQLLNGLSRITDMSFSENESEYVIKFN